MPARFTRARWPSSPFCPTAPVQAFAQPREPPDPWTRRGHLLDTFGVREWRFLAGKRTSPQTGQKRTESLVVLEYPRIPRRAQPAKRRQVNAVRISPLRFTATCSG